MKELFFGELVRLAMEEPDAIARAEVHWQRDSEFVRLAGGGLNLFSEKKIKDWTEKRIEKDPQPERYGFNILTLADDRLVGFLGMGLELVHGEVWVGIGIGERENWNKGYGTDAMKLCLRYAFWELGAQRVSLGLHEYNPRALRSYEKAGFRLEGRTRKDILREGKRTDTLWMGILREEWLAMQEGEKA
ncbi:MAG: GNAT family N-acetyltransferase [Bacteroidota bacterium]